MKKFLLTLLTCLILTPLVQGKQKFREIRDWNELTKSEFIAEIQKIKKRGDYAIIKLEDSKPDGELKFKDGSILYNATGSRSKMEKHEGSCYVSPHLHEVKPGEFIVNPTFLGSKKPRK